MKKFFLFALLVFYVLGSNSQVDSSFYYYKDEKVSLRICFDKIGILLASEQDSLNSLWDSLHLHLCPIFGNNGKFFVLEMDDESVVSINIVNVLKNLRQINSVSYIHEYNGLFVGLTNDFNVCLKNDVSIDLLQNILRSHECFIKDTSLFEERRYLVSKDKDADFTVFELANLFFESGLCEFAEPDFVTLNGFQSVDPYYTDQWGLKNTGQSGGTSGIDINVESAWNITQGNPNIKVAVIDKGVELSHPDLAPNIIQGYSAVDTTGGAPSDNDAHGTACAGIIAAKANNGIGVAGVAPGCKIIPTNVTNLAGYVSDYLIGQTINWAWHHGADVISFSWSGPPSSSITRAIDSATVLGRDGLGTIVVCPSGNNNASTVNYPANLDNVISVGAIDRCGYRSGKNNYVPISCDYWSNTGVYGSAYGKDLNLVAPGSSVLTTDRLDSLGINNYSDLDYAFFYGTSMACPHVAGVVALMLSVNPNHSRYYIKKLIEKSANRINQQYYIYSLTAEHPNGLWNEQVGYGLVDAYSAVLRAKETDLYIRDSFTDNGAEPSDVEYAWTSPDIWLEDANGNVINNPVGGNTYTVCVRIHNKTIAPSSGDEKLVLNWVKAGIGTCWYEDWTGQTSFSCNGISVPKGGYIGNMEGVTIPSVPIHGSIVVRVPWTTPMPLAYQNCSEFGDQLWHFCLLARIHDGNVIVGEQEHGFGMVKLAQQNNNVAWKNIYFLEGSANSALIGVSNPTTSNPLKCAILYKAIPNSFGEYINDFAEVFIQPESAFSQRWISCGMNGYNYQLDTVYLFPTVPQMSINFTDTVARVGLIYIFGSENFILRVGVDFFAGIQPENDTMAFEVFLVDEMGYVIGGEQFTTIRTNGRLFHAVAHESRSVLAGERITLFADNINEPAVYRWYDEYGREISGMDSVAVVPQKTETYKLKVVAEEDEYIDYDDVTLHVLHGKINSVVPNPAINQVAVEFCLANSETNAIIQLADILGEVLESHLVVGEQGSDTFNVRNIPAGQYYLKLISSSRELLDVKILIVQ